MNFACDRCAKRYTLDDDKVPTRGFRLTCKQCGHVIVVRPMPPPLPPPQLPSRSVAAAPAPAPTPAPVPATATMPVDEHEHFFTSPPDSHPPATTQELVLSLKMDLPNRLPAITIGAMVAVGLVMGGAWWAGLLGGSGARTGTAREPGSGRPDGPPGSPPRPAPAEPIPAPPSPPEPAPPAPPVTQRAGQAVPVGGQARVGPAPSSQDRRGRVGAPIGKRDKKLLDLLGRKDDAPGVSAPAAEELSTGRASLQEATVRGALAANSSAFSACIGKAAKADPGFRLGRNTLVMELVVQPSGLVSKATMQDSRYAHTALGRCLVAAARRMVFPSFEGEQILVQAPLKLSAVQ